MEFRIRQSVPVRPWIILALSCLAGLGWMVTAHLLGRLAEKESWWTFGAPLLREIAQAVFIGSAIGVLVNWFLHRLTVEDSRPGLGEHGISRLYSSRFGAREDFVRCVQDPRNKLIWIGGISLQDFLTGGGSLQGVWQEIWRRLKEEHQRQLPSEERMRVRILLLDPQSGAGRFRQSVEKGAVAASNHEFHVRIAINQIETLLKDVYGAEQSEFLEVRLYEHSPFAFLFLSEELAIVEQYCFRDYTKSSFLPLIRYDAGVDSYSHLLNSFSITWKNAYAARLLKHRVGVADGIINARILNIFRHNTRDVLGLRQIESILSAQPGEEICIQAITGRFYTRSAWQAIRDISYGKENEKPVKVRFLIVNPVSQQAIIRAIADSCKQDDFGRALAEWSWEKHIGSPLYTDAWQVIRSCQDLRQAGYSIELRLTPAPLTSSVLLTPKSAFVEQYVYGRSLNLQKGFVLGAEYPVIEFEMLEGVEQEILRSAFDVMWNWLSIPIDEYDSMGEKEQFTINLGLVQAYRPDSRAIEAA